MFEARPTNDGERIITDLPSRVKFRLLTNVCKSALTRLGRGNHAANVSRPATEGLPQPARSVMLRTARGSRAQALKEVSSEMAPTGQDRYEHGLTVKANPCSIHPPSRIWENCI